MTELSKQMKNKLKKMVAANQLEEVCKILMEASEEDPEVTNAIVLQSARYHTLQRLIQSGTQTVGEINNELNKIRTNLLTLIDDNEYLEDSPLPNSKGAEKQFRSEFESAWAKIAVVEALHQLYPQAKQITAIQNLAEVENRKLVFQFLNALVANQLATKESRKEGKSNKAFWVLNDEGIQYFAQYR
ncbi:MAG: hypothetical protein AAFQ68_08240 [Bacteroidota bacterium]